MVNPIILDAAVLVLIIIAILEGRRKGFIKMLWKVSAWLITLVLVLVLIEPVTDLIMTTEAVKGLIDRFTIAFESNLSQSEFSRVTPEKIAELTNVPLMFISENITAGINNGITSIAVSLAQSVAGIIVKLATGLGLFIVLRILMAVVYRVLNLATKLPVIKGINSFLGMLMGLINIMFIIYIVLGITALAIDTESGWNSMVNATYIVKYFYNNNILLSLMG